MSSIIKISLVALLAVFLTACGNDSSTAIVKQAVAIESGDECHLCGMIITQFPGPKGETFSKHAEQAQKFCSTRDMFAYYLQPENKGHTTQLYVHDMAKSHWDRPDDTHFTDAKTAWYVIEHSQQGSMGATLASFSDKEHANSFAKEFGGRVIDFTQIDTELVLNL